MCLELLHSRFFLKAASVNRIWCVPMCACELMVGLPPKFAIQRNAISLAK